ncbi:MAG: MetS family NSS transporter small subunit, partial [Gemmatimonadetes bacterium]|nr:MetS family NSS transporter small subunit [Gemmatimonadota bacterium]
LIRPRKRRSRLGARRRPLFRGRRHKPTAKSKGAGPMTTATWITMIVIMAFVWGGLVVAVRTAVRKESAKSAE